MGLLAELRKKERDLELLDEWRKLLAVKQKAVRERGNDWRLGSVALADDEHALTWQKAHDRICEIKIAFFGTVII